MSGKTSTAGVGLTLFQFATSWVIAWYAVKLGIPYWGIGPIPWWMRVLRWPWYFLLGLNPFVALCVLFLIYFAAAALIIRYLIVRPVLRYSDPLVRLSLRLVRGNTVLLDNDRLSHWLIGALFSWVMMFFVVGIPVFHFWLKVPLQVVGTFVGICCAAQLGFTPWLFSARATRENPSGRIQRRIAAVTGMVATMSLLLVYYLRRLYPDDIETHQFTSIAMGTTPILFSIIYWLVRSQYNNGKQSTPD